MTATIAVRARMVTCRGSPDRALVPTVTEGALGRHDALTQAHFPGRGVATPRGVDDVRLALRRVRLGDDLKSAACRERDDQRRRGQQQRPDKLAHFPPLVARLEILLAQLG